MLAPELVTEQGFSSQPGPEDDFRICHAASKLLRESARFILAVSHVEDPLRLARKRAIHLPRNNGGGKGSRTVEFSASKKGLFARFTSQFTHAITALRGSQDMHDINAIRDDPQAFVRGLQRRGVAAQAAVAEILAKDRELRGVKARLQQAQARRNEASKLIGQAKAKKDEAQAAALMAEVAGLKDEIQAGEQQERDLGEALKNELAVIPNLPASDVPDGASEDDNRPVEARHFHAHRTAAAGMNQPKDHVALGEALGMMDFERAAKVSGARFVYLKGVLAKLNRALASFMLDSHTTKFGYTEFQPPLMVRDEAAFGTGQLP
ncbi:MAG: hypothetical protein ACXWLE_12215, partial [Rhizomicrobium sp.]